MSTINNHSLARNLKYKNRNTKVYLSKKPDGRVMLFVHGFNGDPIKTWGNFPGILTTMPDFSGIDLIFYNYDSKNVQAYNSGIILAQFLDKLIKDPSSIIVSSKINDEEIYHHRSSNFTYKKIYLIAHSLGAIVSRLAINRSHKNGSQWHKFTKLVLVAPAHNGARVGAIRSIAELFFPGPLRFIPSVGFFKIVTIDDVDLSLPNCILHTLTKDTMILQGDPTHKFTIAKLVLVAQGERIVRNNDFLNDPPANLIEDSDHTSICKPEFDNLEIIKQLESVLTS